MATSLVAWLWELVSAASVKNGADQDAGRPARVSARDVTMHDEASQVAPTDWLHLADTTARSGARIIAVGDEYQLGAIGAGGVFSLLADRYGRWSSARSTDSPAGGGKQASHALRDGDTGVIAEYQAQGRIFLAPED